MLEKKEKTILFAGLGVVIFAIVFNLFLEPFLKKNNDLNKDIHVTRSKLFKYARLLKKKDAIESRYRELSSNFKIDLKKEDAMVDILSAIETLAKQANIQIVETRPQANAEGVRKTQKELLVDLRTSGDVEGYMRFIYDVENSLYLLKISRMELAVKSGSRILEGDFLITRPQGND